jgi:hypothetical protein
MITTNSMTVVVSDIQLESTKAFAASVGFVLSAQRETHRDEGAQLYTNEGRYYSNQPLNSGHYNDDYRYYELTFKRPDNDPALAVCQEKMALNKEMVDTYFAISHALWNGKGPYNHHRLQKTGITFGSILMGIGLLCEFGALVVSVGATQSSSSQTYGSGTTLSNAQVATGWAYVGLVFLLLGLSLFLVSLIFDILGNKKAKPYNQDMESISNLHAAYVTALMNMPADRKLQKTDFDFDAYDAIAQRYGRTRQTKIE